MAEEGGAAEPRTPPYTDALAGYVLAGLVLLSVANGFDPDFPRWPAGVAAWCAGAMLARYLTGVLRIQVVAMLALGVAGLLWGSLQGANPRLEQAVSANQALLAMLAGVSFLRLIALPRAGRGESLPVGARALWRTLLGVHFFGAIINLSAVMILGERQAARAPLTPLQAVVLSRGFSAAANWSPFFAAMGVALTHAPGSRLGVMAAVGLPVALLALVLTGWSLARRPEAAEFRGYPMHFVALALPALLTAAVLLLRELWQHVPILTWIALLSPLIAAAVLLAREGGAGGSALHQHVRAGLPRMAGELMLFLAAGVLAAGISSAAETSALLPMPQAFGPAEAAWLLAGMVVLAAAGVHPVISISVAGGMLMPLVADPNLLGIVFLMAWALGVCASPISGMHLAMQGRFGIRAAAFPRWNARYVLLMLVVDAAALHLYARMAA